jgi:ribosomal-protein-alanine N-acetyltransferase
MGSGARPGPIGGRRVTKEKKGAEGKKERQSGAKIQPPPIELTIRAATESDLAAIHAIELASFADPWALTGFRDMIEHSRARVEAAIDSDGTLIGYAVAWYVADEAEIANVAVAPAMRQRGIGSKLLDRILEAAASLGARTVFLEVRESNLAAQRLYASRAFAVAGRRKLYYRRPDEDALIMRRVL